MTHFPVLRYLVYSVAHSVKPPIVLVHGFASCGEQMWTATGWVKRLNAAGFPVVVIDLPYHSPNFWKDSAPISFMQASSSGEIMVTGDELISAVANSLAHLIADLGGRAHCVGFSIGARISYQLASAYPELVESLTLGGLPQNDDLADIEGYLHEYLHHGSQSHLSAHGVFPTIIRNSIITPEALYAFVQSPIDFEIDIPTNHPVCPTLIAVGDADSVAGTPSWLEKGLKNQGVSTQVLILGRRDHINSLTSGEFKKATISHMKNTLTE